MGTEMIDVPTEFGVYGVWAYKINSHYTYSKNQVKGMHIPCDGMQHIDTMRGTTRT